MNQHAAANRFVFKKFPQFDRMGSEMTGSILFFILFTSSLPLNKFYFLLEKPSLTVYFYNEIIKSKYWRNTQKSKFLKIA